MYSTLSYQIANAHTADLYQQAARERAARATGHTRSAQLHDRTRPVAGRTVTAATHRVRVLLGAYRPSPTR